MDAGLLVGRDHVFVCAQGLPLPGSCVEIENTACLVGKIGIPGEDPAAMLPRADGVFREPPPDGRVADRGDEAPANDLSLDLSRGEAGQGQADLARQLAGEGLNGDDGVGGERRPVGPRGSSSRPSKPFCA